MAFVIDENIREQQRLAQMSIHQLQRCGFKISQFHDQNDQLRYRATVVANLTYDNLSLDQLKQLEATYLIPKRVLAPAQG